MLPCWGFLPSVREACLGTEGRELSLQPIKVCKGNQRNERSCSGLYWVDNKWQTSLYTTSLGLSGLFFSRTLIFAEFGDFDWVRPCPYLVTTSPNCGILDYFCISMSKFFFNLHRLHTKGTLFWGFIVLCCVLLLWFLLRKGQEHRPEASCSLLQLDSADPMASWAAECAVCCTFSLGWFLSLVTPGLVGAQPHQLFPRS